MREQSEDKVPTDDALAEALRTVVREIYSNGELESLTVKRVRKATEERLGLEDEFFRDGEWRQRSKDIIEATAAELGPDENDGSSPPIFATNSSKEITSSSSKTRKRSAPEPLNPGKRRKTNTEPIAWELKRSAPGKENFKAIPSSRGSSASQQDSPSKSSEVTRSPKLGGTLDSQSAAGIGPRAEEEGTDALAKTKGKGGDDSESELSSVIDDAPPLRQKKQQSARQETKSKTKSKVRSKNSKSPDIDPDAEEIKRLQGWLIKCGIRKMWARELKDCDTPKAKIRHLKQMLTDAGMTGRYSVDKANQIRETRELQADLEAVQEGAKHWGRTESEKEGSRPKRRLAKGLQDLDFLNDSDGEET